VATDKKLDLSPSPKSGEAGAGKPILLPRRKCEGVDTIIEEWMQAVDYPSCLSGSKHELGRQPTVRTFLRMRLHPHEDSSREIPRPDGR
jgi:hypothetical protein